MMFLWNDLTLAWKSRLYGAGLLTFRELGPRIQNNHCKSETRFRKDSRVSSQSFVLRKQKLPECLNEHAHYVFNTTTGEIFLAEAYSAKNVFKCGLEKHLRETIVKLNPAFIPPASSCPLCMFRFLSCAAGFCSFDSVGNHETMSSSNKLKK